VFMQINTFYYTVVYYILLYYSTTINSKLTQLQLPNEPTPAKKYETAMNFRQNPK